MNTEAGFHEVGEVEVDRRHRVALGRIPGVGDPYNRYAVRVNGETGEILLAPLVTVSPRELAVLRNPQTISRLRDGIAAAAAGDVVRGALNDNRKRHA